MKFNLEEMNEQDKKRIEKAMATYVALQKSVKAEKPLGEEFKTDYCKYYGLNRFFTEQDKEAYFCIFEEQRKTKQCDFEQLLWELNKIQGKVWVSFASKMLASINPSLPVWDSVVVQKLHKEKGLSYLPTSKMSADKKIPKVAERYQQFKKCIDELKKEATQQNFFNLFQEVFPQAKHLTKEKMLDLYLWGIRK